MSLNESSSEASLEALCKRLAELAPAADSWPEASLAACGKAGVYRWFHEATWGGWNWLEQEVLRGYLALSSACLTTTFVITQRTAACQRLERSDNQSAKERWLPKLVAGEIFATVGISHLTTSRQHVAPVMQASRDGSDFILSGSSPWVTGAIHADLIVTGATLDDGSQILVALPTALRGVEIPEPLELLSLSGSATGSVFCHDVRVNRGDVLFGPRPEVMKAGAGGGTGGLQTSTLALGLSRTALDYLNRESQNRESLIEICEAFERRYRRLVDQLLFAADPNSNSDLIALRRDANDLVLQSTQAALAAAKGTGYVVGHGAGRWATEALFFLVWSCPLGVIQSHLCDWAAESTLS